MIYVVIFLSLNLFFTNCSDNCTLDSGYRLEEDGKISEAIACYESLLTTKDSIAASERLSIVYGNRGDFEKAISYGQKVFASDQQNLSNKLNLGNWYFKKGQIEQALNYFLMVERADSLLPELNFNLAVIYLTEFDAPELARKYIEREVENFGYSEDKYALIGQTYFQLNLYKNSEIAFSKAIEKNSENAFYYFQRAILYYYWDKYSEAITDLDTAVALEPQFTDAMLLKIDIGIETNAPYVCDVISQIESQSVLPEALLEVRNECLEK